MAFGKRFRWAELAVPPGGKAGFTQLTPEQTGITLPIHSKSEPSPPNGQWPMVPGRPLGIFITTDCRPFFLQSGRA